MNIKRILVCGPNWIGDGVMAMPALQMFREQTPDCTVSMLVKPAMGVLWAMHPDVDEVLLLPPGLRGIFQAAARLRETTWEAAYVLPNSVRATLPVRLGGIATRIGFARSQGRLLLTHRVAQIEGPERRHQAYEALDLLLPDCGEQRLPPPRIEVPEADRHEATRLLPGEETRWIGILPGASRGPSKRWPAGHFHALSEQLSREDNTRIVLMGGSAERSLCESVAQGLSPHAVNLAGHTTLSLWAALLERCRVVVCNDSGGMHLAAAVGTPVVALFGQTDPSITGPLGRAEVLQRSTVKSRDIARDSEEARKSLASIPPEQVYEAVRRMSDR